MYWNIILAACLSAGIGLSACVGLSRFCLHAMLFGNARAVATLWNLFIQHLRFSHWELLQPLPRMTTDPLPHHKIQPAASQPSPVAPASEPAIGSFPDTLLGSGLHDSAPHSLPSHSMTPPPDSRWAPTGPLGRDAHTDSMQQGTHALHPPAQRDAADVPSDLPRRDYTLGHPPAERAAHPGHGATTSEASPPPLQLVAEASDEPGDGPHAAQHPEVALMGAKQIDTRPIRRRMASGLQALAESGYQRVVQASQHPRFHGLHMPSRAGATPAATEEQAAATDDLPPAMLCGQGGEAGGMSPAIHGGPPAPDLRQGLLFQKLQMLDLCIHRQRVRVAEAQARAQQPGRLRPMLV